MIKKKIVFRTDGDIKIGLGHIYRCIGIAEMLCNDFDCEFLLESQSKIDNVIPKHFTIKHIPNDYSIELEHQWIQSNYDTNSLLIILDGYKFTSLYQKNIKKIQAKLIYIDDLLCEHMFADAVINHTPNVNINLYKKETYTKLYTGLDYVLLRQSFINEATLKKETNSNISSALITFGGSDEHNITLKILKSLLTIKKINSISIIVGELYPHKNSLVSEINHSSKNIQLFSGLSEIKMIELMKKSDIAFAPCSTTCLELIAVNSLIFAGYSASNQKHLYNYLKSQQLIFDLGDLHTITSKEVNEIIMQHIDNRTEINKMLFLQNQIIDGKSGGRVKKIVKDLI